MNYHDVVLYRHWSHVPDWFWDICPNFHPARDHMMASPDTGAIQIHIPSYRTLQRFRDVLQESVYINSGYRSPVYNAEKGGAPNSYHKELIAWDLYSLETPYEDRVRVAREVGFTGIGIYPRRNFTHVDMGRRRTFYGSRRDKQMYEAMTTQEIIL